MSNETEIADLGRLLVRTRYQRDEALAQRDQVNAEYQQLSIVRDVMYLWSYDTFRQRNGFDVAQHIDASNWSTDGGPAEIARARLADYLSDLDETLLVVGQRLVDIELRLKDLSARFWELETRATTLTDQAETIRHNMAVLRDQQSALASASNGA